MHLCLGLCYSLGLECLSLSLLSPAKPPVQGVISAAWSPSDALPSCHMPQVTLLWPAPPRAGPTLCSPVCQRGSWEDRRSLGPGLDDQSWQVDGRVQPRETGDRGVPCP